uniref:Anaphase-promoting complex subunit 4 WD40 domain-containing protein n=1 Tax=Amphimedon queenslandica TaxID=400682 RepID=A0A1X7SIM4_AMPQE
MHLQCINLALINFHSIYYFTYLALGNQVGKIYIWDTTQNDVIKGRPSVILSSAKCFTAVRQVTFSNDSKTIIGVCDNGT